VGSRYVDAGFLRGVGNYGRYQPGFIHSEHHWVVGKSHYWRTSSCFAQPWYAPRVAVGGMIAMTTPVVFLNCGDAGISEAMDTIVASRLA